MEPLTLVLATLLTNVFMQVVKKVGNMRPKDNNSTVYLRGVQALLGIIMVFASAYFIGEPLETAQTSDLFNSMLMAALTFVTSKGSYNLFIRHIVKS